MKKALITMTAGLLLSGSCTLYTSFSHHDSHLSVTATGDNDDGSVSEGGELTIEISGEDGDGIASILVEIPALSYARTYDTGRSGDRWEITQTIQVTEINDSAHRDIDVTLTDDERDTFRKTTRLNIK